MQLIDFIQSAGLKKNYLEQFEGIYNVLWKLDLNGWYNFRGQLQQGLIYDNLTWFNVTHNL